MKTKYEAELKEKADLKRVIVKLEKHVKEPKYTDYLKELNTKEDKINRKTEETKHEFKAMREVEKRDIMDEEENEELSKTKQLLELNEMFKNAIQD